MVVIEHIESIAIVVVHALCKEQHGSQLEITNLGTLVYIYLDIKIAGPNGFMHMGA